MSDSLANFSRSEVESHNSPKSCYVTVGANVYDVTDFLDSHPGGDDLILQYAGQDVAAILQDESSHLHSEAAYEVLNDSLVGFVASERSPGEKRRKQRREHCGGKFPDQWQWRLDPSRGQAWRARRT